MNQSEVSDKFEKLARHPFTKDVVTLQVGTIVNTGIAFVTSLILASLLGPEQYGLYVLVFALAGIINIFQEFGIGQGTINLLARAYAQKNREEAIKILSSFTRISILAALIPGVLGAALAPYLGKEIYNDSSLGKLASIVVITVAIEFFFPLSTIALQVSRRIKPLTLWEMVHKFLDSAIPIILVATAGLGVFGVVSGQLISTIIVSAVGLILYLGLRKKESWFPGFREFWKKKPDLPYLKSFFRFGFAIAVNKNLIKLAQTIPILLAGFFLATNSTLGYYKIALAYMSVPLTLLGPVSRLLNIQFPRTEAVGGPKRLLQRFFQVTLLSFALGIAITLPLLLIGPYFLRFFFPEYEPSIALLYPLTLYPIFMSMGIGLGALFRTLNQMRIAARINLISVLLMIPTAYLLIGNYAIRGLVATVLIFSLLPNILSFIYFGKMYRDLRHGREAI